ncbi:MAG: hypothetical protein JXL97_16265 [Bacteroidales bacterium]|nr:hypothetical protein [Bacteroidales bacterium]
MKNLLLLLAIFSILASCNNSKKFAEIDAILEENNEYFVQRSKERLDKILNEIEIYDRNGKIWLYKATKAQNITENAEKKLDSIINEKKSIMKKKSKS